MGVIAGEGLELDMQEYKAIDSYKAEETSQLSFETGEVIMVLDKMEDGKQTVRIHSIQLHSVCPDSTIYLH